MAHREHAQAAQFLGRVEDHWRESRRHLRVEADLDARLNFIFALDLRGASSRRGSTRSRGHVDGVIASRRRHLHDVEVQ